MSAAGAGPQPIAAPRKRWRVAYVVSHPIQYQAPLLRYLTSHSAVDVTALFLSDVSCRSYRDEGFGREVEWDVDLLGGYAHEFLPTLGRSDQLTSLRPVNRGIESALRRGNYDAVWLHGYVHPTNLRALAAARRLDLPVLLRGESLLLGKDPAGLKSRLRDWALPRLLRRVDAFLAIGSANRDFYEHYGILPERIHRVPYAVDNRRFAAQAREATAGREGLRSKLGLEQGRAVLLYASKFSARKRPLDVLDALAHLHRAGEQPLPHLVMVGDGEQRDELEQRAAALPAGTVHFTGFINQTELPRYYDLCDALVLPSQYEPWGLVVNEAMCAERPVIASEAVGSGVDLIVEGQTGFRFPVGDAVALADRIARLLALPDRGRALGRAAAERVGTWDFAADAAGLEAALQQVVLCESTEVAA
ncbi:Alpha-D-kanosaminyltransferase [Planctomycetes bacterium Pla86]|uniref:Alpha-D-kanosaminyltransferase n=2 Tax=Engelhardtia mirabilis TaxID=2528011 RepID=A0A518BJJ3_9BACT|nr:Alpha-D-kanosaminyltransferase [Planctomycetes bacterium Pla133]QDV01477.1 Alpha-D-kanosaminyltransferase [Planctomycetes bacterium Pla86]